VTAIETRVGGATVQTVEPIMQHEVA